MVRISVLNDALKNMYNAEKRGKRQVLIKPSSKVIIKFLLVMQQHGERPSPPPQMRRVCFETPRSGSLGAPAPQTGRWAI